MRFLLFYFFSFVKGEGEEKGPKIKVLNPWNILSLRMWKRNCFLLRKQIVKKYRFDFPKKSWVWWSIWSFAFYKPKRKNCPNQLYNFAFAIHFGCPKGNTKEDYGNEKEKKKKIKRNMFLLTFYTQSIFLKEWQVHIENEHLSVYWHGSAHLTPFFCFFKYIFRKSSVKTCLSRRKKRSPSQFDLVQLSVYSHICLTKVWYIRGEMTIFVVLKTID